MNNKPYNVFYNNFTGRVIVQKNTRYNSPTKRIPPNLPNSYTNDFEKKIQELSKSINTPDNVSIENSNNSINLKSYPNNNNNQNINQDLNKNTVQNTVQNINMGVKMNHNINLNENNNDINNKRIIIEDKIKNTVERLNLNNNERNNISKQNLIYGIKKTILSEFNYLYQSSNSNDFKLGLNKNFNKNIFIFDSFYLFPNISEINTTTETNIINEKKVDLFMNNYDTYDIQPFPIDFVPCGVNIPLKSFNKNFKKIIIKNIYWNIFQSINSNNYELDELLCTIPQKNDFIYKKIKLQINFELHSQVSGNIFKKYDNNNNDDNNDNDNNSNNRILPYKNNKIKYSTPANSCLYKVINIKIDKLNGSYFENLEIELLEELPIDCALLCLKISVPEESVEILKGTDKNNNVLFGNIPFSQFILNFDYDLI